MSHASGRLRRRQLLQATCAQILLLGLLLLAARGGAASSDQPGIGDAFPSISSSCPSVFYPLPLE